MRRVGHHFLHHPHDLSQLVHQTAFVLQPAGRIDKHHVVAFCNRFLQAVETKTGAVTAVFTGKNPHSGTRTPHLQLLDRRRAKGIGGNQRHLQPLRFQFGRKLADGSGFSGAVYPRHQNHKRFFAFRNRKLPLTGSQKLFQLRRQLFPDFLLGNFLILPHFGKFAHNRGGGSHSHVGSNQQFLQLLQRFRIKFPFGKNAADTAADFLRRFF